MRGPERRGYVASDWRVYLDPLYVKNDTLILTIFTELLDQLNKVHVFSLASQATEGAQCYNPVTDHSCAGSLSP
jgi:hypothetical protein